MKLSLPGIKNVPAQVCFKMAHVEGRSNVNKRKMKQR